MPHDPAAHPQKRRTGLERVRHAAGYSWAGLRSGYRLESAFRQEVWLFALALPLALWLGRDGGQRLLLIGSLGLVLIVELLNSAIEAVVDRIGYEHHELAGRAKDYGSAAVLLSLGLAGVVWATLIWQRLTA